MCFQISLWQQAALAGSGRGDSYSAGQKWMNKYFLLVFLRVWHKSSLYSWPQEIAIKAYSAFRCYQTNCQLRMEAYKTFNSLMLDTHLSPVWLSLASKSAGGDWNIFLSELTIAVWAHCSDHLVLQTSIPDLTRLDCFCCQQPVCLRMPKRQSHRLFWYSQLVMINYNKIGFVYHCKCTHVAWA